MTIDREIAAQQTHCYSCGKRLRRVRYECPICHEFSCSEKCRRQHIETMDRV
jgi:hypothetical protein